MMGDTAREVNIGQNIMSQSKAEEYVIWRFSKNAMKAFDMLQPQLYIKTNLEMHKTDYTDEKTKVQIDTRLLP